MSNIKTQYIINYISIILNKKFEEIDTDDLKNIKTISLSSTDITGEYQPTFIEDIKLMPNIEELDLSNMIISNDVVKSISLLNKIKKIKFYNCEFITNISPITTSSNIEQLSFYTTMPTDISSIGHIKTLKSLELINLKLTDLSFLKELVNLNDISFSNSKILDKNFLHLVRNIKVLKICNTNANKIEFVKHLNELEEIHIDETQYQNNLEIVKYLSNKGISIYDSRNYLYS